MYSQSRGTKHEIYIYIFFFHTSKNLAGRNLKVEKRVICNSRACFRAILEIKIKLIYKNMMYEITLSPSHCENMSISH